MSLKIELFNSQDLSDPGSIGFSYRIGALKREGFAVLKDGVMSAFENKCPHTGAPLDWVEHQFLDADKEFIQCAVHDARFIAETGECVFGPCVGKNLSRLDVVLENQKIYLLVK